MTSLASPCRGYAFCDPPPPAPPEALLLLQPPPPPPLPLPGAAVIVSNPVLTIAAVFAALIFFVSGRRRLAHEGLYVNHALTLLLVLPFVPVATYLGERGLVDPVILTSIFVWTAVGAIGLRVLARICRPGADAKWREEADSWVKALPVRSKGRKRVGAFSVLLCIGSGGIAMSGVLLLIGSAVSVRTSQHLLRPPAPYHIIGVDIFAAIAFVSALVGLVACRALTRRRGEGEAAYAGAALALLQILPLIPVVCFLFERKIVPLQVIQFTVVSSALATAALRQLAPPAAAGIFGSGSLAMWLGVLPAAPLAVLVWGRNGAFWMLVVLGTTSLALTWLLLAWEKSFAERATLRAARGMDALAEVFSYAIGAAMLAVLACASMAVYLGMDGTHAETGHRVLPTATLTALLPRGWTLVGWEVDALPLRSTLSAVGWLLLAVAMCSACGCLAAWARDHRRRRTVSKRVRESRRSFYHDLHRQHSGDDISAGGSSPRASGRTTLVDDFGGLGGEGAFRPDEAADASPQRGGCRNSLYNAVAADVSRAAEMAGGACAGAPAASRSSRKSFYSERRQRRDPSRRARVIIWNCVCSVYSIIFVYI